VVFQLGTELMQYDPITIEMRQAAGEISTIKIELVKTT
jgi:hypothetical protein